MVDIIDSTYPITVLKSIEEGNLQITNVTAPSEALPGTFFDIDIAITNLGGDDACFVWIYDADTGIYVSQDGRFSAPGYSSFSITASNLLMPDKDWNLVIQAGHEE